MPFIQLQSITPKLYYFYSVKWQKKKKKRNSSEFQIQCLSKRSVLLETCNYHFSQNLENLSFFLCLYLTSPTTCMQAVYSNFTTRWWYSNSSVRVRFRSHFIRNLNSIKGRGGNIQTVTMHREAQNTAFRKTSISTTV